MSDTTNNEQCPLVDVGALVQAIQNYGLLEYDIKSIASLLNAPYEAVASALHRIQLQQQVSSLEVNRVWEQFDRNAAKSPSRSFAEEAAVHPLFKNNADILMSSATGEFTAPPRLPEHQVEQQFADMTGPLETEQRPIRHFYPKTIEELEQEQALRTPWERSERQEEQEQEREYKLRKRLEIDIMDP